MNNEREIARYRVTDVLINTGTDGEEHTLDPKSTDESDDNSFILKRLMSKVTVISREEKESLSHRRIIVSVMCHLCVAHQCGMD